MEKRRNNIYTHIYIYISCVLKILNIGMLQARMVSVAFTVARELM
jgi:hypothetical protein